MLVALIARDKAGALDVRKANREAHLEYLKASAAIVEQAGPLLGKRVLVTGCGPIGVLSVLVARRAGASQIVATDLTGFTLQKARESGADLTLNTAETPEALDQFTQAKGHFDVLFECTGVAAALASAIPAIRPGGIIVQLGLGGDMTLPVQALTAKELQLRGSFRFHEEFFIGVTLMLIWT